MVTRSPGTRAIVFALAFCLSCVGLIFFLWLALGGSVPFAPQGYRFHILLGQAGQLYPGTEVRIAGVDVGRVVAVHRRGIDTDATIELESAYTPLRSDARALLRQKTLLGERFIALTPGSRGAPSVPDGGTLAPTRVLRAQTLDEVLNSFDAPTRAHFRDLLQGVSTTLGGARGGELNSALGNAGPAAANLTSLLSTLDGQDAALRGLVRDTGTVLDAVSRRQAGLRALVVSGDRLLASTAGHGSALTRAVRALPPFLTELRLTLGAADHTAAVAEPTLTALRGVAPLVRPALLETLAVAPALETFMRRLGPFLGVETRALPSAQQLLDASLSLMRKLYPAARDVVPVVAFMSAYRRELVAALANVAASMQASAPSDTGAPQHYLRTLVPFNNESMLGAAQRLPTNRHNAYYAPGELTRLGHGGLRASDCRNLSNPSPVPSALTGTPPPCQVAPPWLFAGERALFHRVTPANP